MEIFGLITGVSIFNLYLCYFLSTIAGGIRLYS